MAPDPQQNPFAFHPGPPAPGSGSINYGTFNPAQNPAPSNPDPHAVTYSGVRYAMPPQPSSSHHGAAGPYPMSGLDVFGGPIEIHQSQQDRPYVMNGGEGFAPSQYMYPPPPHDVSYAPYPTAVQRPPEAGITPARLGPGLRSTAPGSSDSMMRPLSGNTGQHRPSTADNSSDASSSVQRTGRTDTGTATSSDVEAESPTRRVRQRLPTFEQPQSQASASRKRKGTPTAPRANAKNAKKTKLLCVGEDPGVEGIPPGPRPLGRPDVSFAWMIGNAIRASRAGGLSLDHIYRYIAASYPHFRNDATGDQWRNSVRHNLSIHKMFVSVPRTEKHPPGKGNIWTIPDEEMCHWIPSNEYPEGTTFQRTFPPSHPHWATCLQTKADLQKEEEAKAKAEAEGRDYVPKKGKRAKTVRQAQALKEKKTTSRKSRGPRAKVLPHLLPPHPVALMPMPPPHPHPHPHPHPYPQGPSPHPNVRQGQPTMPIAAAHLHPHMAMPLPGPGSEAVGVPHAVDTSINRGAPDEKALTSPPLPRDGSLERLQVEDDGLDFEPEDQDDGRLRLLSFKTTLKRMIASPSRSGPSHGSFNRQDRFFDEEGVFSSNGASTSANLNRAFRPPSPPESVADAVNLSALFCNDEDNLFETPAHKRPEVYSGPASGSTLNPTSSAFKKTPALTYSSSSPTSSPMPPSVPRGSSYHPSGLQHEWTGDKDGHLNGTHSPVGLDAPFAMKPAIKRTAPDDEDDPSPERSSLPKTPGVASGVAPRTPRLLTDASSGAPKTPITRSSASALFNTPIRFTTPVMKTPLSFTTPLNSITSLENLSTPMWEAAGCVDRMGQSRRQSEQGNMTPLSVLEQGNWSPKWSPRPDTNPASYSLDSPSRGLREALDTDSPSAKRRRIVS
ncbi:hypothetical protein CC85DRAFT_49905 [Cutaneotrichosporon oleaginosum]|uniref:Fork-head domain-containing protein n=1 Tax=Cutaneotrichosporon oleaginosum TaxID=879819 RepID=A0A0J0XR42_9TREE|nr:uncharacterized protein CC85DRAFT_49905 [Cutaneotrichosporon oleaginosum]KLT43542.1 hypothetical protein CC85DRAFT_49905 [Cutaneotrichosporon oleaginosum]TXT05559.1 hypothetical protein COLE_06879 [Cutaneotrichosporon oleaginosum]